MFASWYEAHARHENIDWVTHDLDKRIAGSTTTDKQPHMNIRIFACILCVMSQEIAASAAQPKGMMPIIRFGEVGSQALISGADLTTKVVKTPPVHWNGKGLEVDFESARWPELKIEIDQRVRNWSQMQELIVPIINLNRNAVNLVTRIDSIGSGSAPLSRSGVTRLQPQEEVALVLPLQDKWSISMGMREGPPPDPPPLNGPVRVIGGAEGQINLRNITTIHFSLPYLDSNSTLIFGEPGTIPGAGPGRNSYVHIADRFGQYTRATWPEKVSSTAQMQIQSRREELFLRKWLAKLPLRDRFGGILEGPTFEANGFFRILHANNRWLLITPEGHEFFSIGVDVVSPDVGATYITHRDFMFTSLPKKTGYLAQHYGKRRAALTFDFYAANLQRKYGRNYLAAWRRIAVARLRAWGFNTIGNWSDPQLIAKGVMPYVLPIDIWGEYAQIPGGAGSRNNMPDVFDPKFATAAEVRIARVASRHKLDAFLIGYFVDNELAWGVGSSSDPRVRYALALNTLRLTADSPAKEAFLRLLVAKYQSVEAFDLAWGVNVSSWDILHQDALSVPDSTLVRSEVAADLSEFTTQYANAYFRTVASAIRRHDPHHLYLGSRFQARTPEAVEACARYCDVVSFNVYDREIFGEEWARFHKLDKPAIIGEFQFGTADRGLFWPGLYNVAAEDQRGPAYAHYLESALSNPDIVGCHWFQYVDEPLTGRVLDGENGHIGFISVSDVPYHGFVAAVRKTNFSLVGALK
jgi:hypothetical protein